MYKYLDMNTNDHNVHPAHQSESWHPHIPQLKNSWNIDFSLKNTKFKQYDIYIAWPMLDSALTTLYKKYPGMEITIDRILTGYMAHIENTLWKKETEWRSDANKFYNIPEQFQKKFFRICNQYFAWFINNLDKHFFSDEKNIIFFEKTVNSLNAMLQIYYFISIVYWSLYGSALRYVWEEWDIDASELQAMMLAWEQGDIETVRVFMWWLHERFQIISKKYLKKKHLNYNERTFIKNVELIEWIEEHLEDWLSTEHQGDISIILDSYYKSIGDIHAIFSPNKDELPSIVTKTIYDSVELDKAWLFQDITFLLATSYRTYIDETDPRKKQAILHWILENRKSHLAILNQIREDYPEKDIFKLPTFQITEFEFAPNNPDIEHLTFLEQLRQLYELTYVNDQLFVTNMLPEYHKKWKKEGWKFYFLYQKHGWETQLPLPVATCRMSDYDRDTDSLFLSSVNIDPSYQGFKLSTFALYVIDRAFESWAKNIYWHTDAGWKAEDMWIKHGFKIQEGASFPEEWTDNTINLIRLTYEDHHAITTSPEKSVEIPPQ